MLACLKSAGFILDSVQEQHPGQVVSKLARLSALL
jgi:hypothetical protein